MYKSRLDRIGIAAAALCLVHCVVVPLVFPVLALTHTEGLENIWVEGGLFLSSVTAGGWAIWQGYRCHHRQQAVVILFITGILLLLAGNVLHGHGTELILKLLGTLVLIGTHVYNWRACKRCRVAS